MPTFDAGEFHAGRRATLILMLALFAFGAVSGWSGREMFDASRPPQAAQAAVTEPKEDEPAAKSQEPRRETAWQELPDESSGSFRQIPAYPQTLPAPAEDVPDEPSSYYPWTSGTPTDAKPASLEDVDESQGLVPTAPSAYPVDPESTGEFPLTPGKPFEQYHERQTKQAGESFRRSEELKNKKSTWRRLRSLVYPGRSELSQTHSDVHEKQTEELLRTSENLKELTERWRRFWFLDQPGHKNPLRTHGGII
jgi:hypothetical protein